MNEAEKRAEILKFMREAGKKGGTERAKKYSKAQISDWAKKAWEKRNPKQQ